MPGHPALPRRPLDATVTAPCSRPSTISPKHSGQSSPRLQDVPPDASQQGSALVGHRPLLPAVIFKASAEDHDTLSSSLATSNSSATLSSNSITAVSQRMPDMGPAEFMHFLDLRGFENGGFENRGVYIGGVGNRTYLEEKGVSEMNDDVNVDDRDVHLKWSHASGSDCLAMQTCVSGTDMDGHTAGKCPGGIYENHSPRREHAVEINENHSADGAQVNQSAGHQISCGRSSGGSTVNAVRMEDTIDWPVL